MSRLPKAAKRDEGQSLADALPKRQRGRPSALWFSPEEVAAFLDVGPEIVLRSLEMPKFRASLWPHAEQGGPEGSWRVPERDVQKLLGPGLPRPLWVKDFAEFIGYSVPQVNVWIRAGVIPSVTIFGKRRVLESVIWELPKHMPAGSRPCPAVAKQAAPAAPSSFLSEQAA